MEGLAVDRHVLAIISIVGSSLDVLGALYLAYDLLGGEHGPLRTVTRGVTYGALFGAAYGVSLGPLFGLICGATHGFTLAWEFSRASRNDLKPGFWFDAGMSAIRGLGFAAGGAFLFGARFGIAFGTLSTVGQIIAYRVGIRPTMDYAPAARPRITKRQLLSSVNRTVGYGLAGYVSSLFGHRKEMAVSLGLEVGVITGVITTVSIFCTPFVEWMADHMPARRMGLLGIGLILAGFLFQSVQYWVTFFDIAVR